MRALAITEKVKADVARCIAYAKANVISWPEVQARATGALTGSVADDPQRMVEIPVGFKCIFSFDMQKWIKRRHLSVSVATKGKYPNEHAVDLIARLFGFKDGVKGQNITLYLEEDPVEAVNIVEAFAEF